MRTVLITYDLNAPGQNYNKVLEVIRSYPRWARLGTSAYEVGTYESVTTVRDNLLRVMNANDTVFVVDVTGMPAAWHGLPSDVGDWLRGAA
jgi:hypothetical protein